MTALAADTVGPPLLSLVLRMDQKELLSCDLLLPGHSKWVRSEPELMSIVTK